MKNFMEDVVAAVYDEYARQHEDFCHCPQCRMDAMALALTKLRGMYAASREGEILTRITCDSRQIKADALVALMDALQVVADHPKH